MKVFVHRCIIKFYDGDYFIGLIEGIMWSPDGVSDTAKCFEETTVYEGLARISQSEIPFTVLEGRPVIRKYDIGPQPETSCPSCEHCGVKLKEPEADERYCGPCEFDFITDDKDAYVRSVESADWKDVSY